MLNALAQSLRVLPRMIVIALLGASLAACSGSDSLGEFGDDDDDNPPTTGTGEAPTAEIAPTGEIGTSDEIVITFSESMDTSSVELGGSIAGEAETEWSRSSADNDTLTLSPISAWSSGAHTLDVDGSDLDGEALETTSSDFQVHLAFADFQQASVVIGQSGFTGGNANQGGSVDANTLDTPTGTSGFAVDENTLFISDTGSSRVLGFNNIPSENNANADFVLGQADFTSAASGTTATAMRTPQTVTAVNGKLIVTDRESHRVLIWNSIPQNGPQAADVVIGQENLASRETACAANRLNNPESHFVTPDGKLLVSDSGNNRVLVWNTIPTASNSTPDMVLGQASFDTCVYNDEDQDGEYSPGWDPHSNTLNYPTGIWSDGEKLLVADSGNHRVLIWSSFPEESFADADALLGQNSFRSMAANDDDQDGVTDGASASVFNFPFGVWSDGQQIYVADRDNHRVLIWEDYPDRYFPPASVVLGQSDFANNAANDRDQDGNADARPGRATLNGPTGVRLVRGQLVVTDSGNSRVLVFSGE